MEVGEMEVEMIYSGSEGNGLTNQNRVAGQRSLKATSKRFENNQKEH